MNEICFAEGQIVFLTEEEHKKRVRVTQVRFETEGMYNPCIRGDYRHKGKVWEGLWPIAYLSAIRPVNSTKL